jgi:2,3-bisphosphoglycerate-independent phosphoglycerate mutase
MTGPAHRILILLGDGMADEPLAELDGRTPLQAARTPAMDRIAREGRCGSLLTLPEGFPTSSDVANMSVLGCDLPSEYCGRGPLEAAGRGISLTPADMAFRLNLVTVEDGVLRDFSGGHPAPDEAAELIDALDKTLGGPVVRIYPGVSYRNLLVIRDADASPAVRTAKPDDHQDEPVAPYRPVAEAPGADATAALLNRLINAAPAVLDAHPVNARRRAAGKPPINAIWPWSGGRAGAIRSLADRYGLHGAVISAVDVIMGLGRCLGMEVIRVPGATGYIDTNYEGKADAAAAALRDHDLVYLHVEAIDEVSHAGDLRAKLRAIEDFDRRVVARALDQVDLERTVVAVLPDHPVPVALRKHTRTPVPVAVRFPDGLADSVPAFDESCCPRGALGAMADGAFMTCLVNA